MTNPTLVDGLINGIGGTMGGGIFLLVGDLVQQNGGLTYLAFVMGAIMCLLVAFCYCILSKEYPSKEGTANYPKKVYKDNKKLQLLINGLICFGYTTLLCVYSLSAGNYVGDFMKIPAMKKILAGAVVALCVLLSYIPPAIMNTVQSAFVYIKLLVLFAVAVFGIVKKGPEGVVAKDNSIVKALIASLGVFVSFEGFEMNSGYSTNMENKEINLPISYFVTIIVSAIVYSGLGIAVNKHIGSTITNENKGSALLDLVKVYGFEKWGPLLIVIINIIANLSANIATISANSPMIDGYVKDIGLDKSVLGSKLTLMGTSQSAALIASCGLAIALILFGPEELVKNSGSLSFLVIFTIVCIMTHKTIKDKEERNEPITIMKKPFSYGTCKTISILGGSLCSLGTLVLLKDMVSPPAPVGSSPAGSVVAPVELAAPVVQIPSVPTPEITTE